MMRVDPSEPACASQAPNHLTLKRLRVAVVSGKEKGSAQVRIMKTNVSEPLMTCRKCRDEVKTGTVSLARESMGVARVLPT